MSVYGGKPRPGGGVIGGVLGGGAVVGGGAVATGGGKDTNDADGIEGAAQGSDTGTAPDAAGTTAIVGVDLPLTGSPAAQIATVGIGIVILGLLLVSVAALVLRHGWRPGRSVSSR